MRCALFSVACATWLVACGDGTLRAFEPLAAAAGDAGEPPVGRAGAGGAAGGMTGMAGAVGTAGSAPSAGTGGTVLSLPLAIDDFEDGDTRAHLPLGWWYPINDATGTQGFGIEPAGSDSTSTYALRTHGSGFQDWGAAIGLNLIGDATPLALPSHGQLCFTARIGSTSSTALTVHFLRDTRHFIRDVTLSESWTRHCLPLTSFISPEGDALVPEELSALQFFFEPRAAFFLWLDDLELVP